MAGKSTPDRNESINRKTGMKIGELSRITGFSRQTIHYYMREGLLHAPTKTRPNVAYYDQSHVDRLKLVRELKEGRRLKIAEIKEVVDREDTGQNGKTLVELLSHETGANKRFSEGEFSSQSGLDAAEVPLLAEAGLLVPREDRTYGEIDLEMAKAFRDMKRTGVPVEYAAKLMLPYVEMLRHTSREEIRHFLDIPLVEADKESMSTTYRRMEPCLEKILLLSRRRALGREMKEAVGEVMQRSREMNREYREMAHPISLSSDYLRPLNPNEIIRGLKAHIEEQPDDLSAYVLLLQVYIAKGDYIRLLEWSLKAVESDPRNQEALMYLGVAHMRNLNYDEALEVMSRCVELHPDYGYGHCLLGIVMLLSGIQKKNILDTISTVRRGIQEFAISREIEPKSVFEDINISGSRGRALTMLPLFMGYFPEGLKELERSMEMAQREREKVENPFLLAVVEKQLLNAFYFLGEAYEIEGRISERNQFWEKFLSIDPKNNLAGWIKERMAED